MQYRRQLSWKGVMGIFSILLSYAFILLVSVYRYFISPLLPTSCRFHPTCSQYALDAVRQYGPFIGLWLTICRICRCHPWHSGGYDPVVNHTKNSIE